MTADGLSRGCDLDRAPRLSPPPSISYQFNPTLLNPDVLLQLLLKALIATPNADFNLSMAVAGDRAVRLQRGLRSPGAALPY
jgi:hypothetical protein